MHIDTTFPPPAPGRLAQFVRMVGHFERNEIEAAVDALIAEMDARAGDPDEEDDDRAALTMRAPGIDYDFEEEPLVQDGLAGSTEDAEDDGDAADGNAGEDDFMSHSGNGPGCPIADSDQCEAHDDDPERQHYDGRPGDPDDAEDSHDVELNGDESDHSIDPNA